MACFSRVCEVTLNGNQTFSLRQQKYKISETLKTGEAVALFGSFSFLHRSIPSHIS